MLFTFSRSFAESESKDYGNDGIKYVHNIAKSVCLDEKLHLYRIVIDKLKFDSDPYRVAGQ